MCTSAPWGSYRYMSIMGTHPGRPLGLGPQDPWNPRAGEIWGGEGHEVGTQPLDMAGHNPAAWLRWHGCGRKQQELSHRLSSSNQPMPDSSWILAGAGRSCGGSDALRRAGHSSCPGAHVPRQLPKRRCEAIGQEPTPSLTHEPQVLPRASLSPAAMGMGTMEH